MTQTIESTEKGAEFKALYLTLNNKDQETALRILKSLGLVQSRMASHEVLQSLDKQIDNE